MAGVIDTLCMILTSGHVIFKTPDGQQPPDAGRASQRSCTGLSSCRFGYNVYRFGTITPPYCRIGAEDGSF